MCVNISRSDPSVHELRARPGCGQLAVSRGLDKSVVTRAFATSPLHWLTPRNHGHAAWAYTSSHGGGLVDDDDIRMSVNVDSGACLFLSTQASTKVYRSPHGTAVTMAAEIEQDGLLVLAPDPVVCFAQARYHQLQKFDLADEAGLVLVDWLSSGRRESGERWAFDTWVSQTEVRLCGQLIIHDTQALRASDGALAERLGQYDVIAAVLVLGAPLKKQATRILDRVSLQQIGQRGQTLIAASAIREHGCMLRVAGRSVEEVWQSLMDHLSFLPSLLGDNPWARKW